MAGIHVYKTYVILCYTDYGRSISHILNCHLCGINKLRQVVIAAPSNECLTTVFELVMIKASTDAYYAFAVKTFLKIGESVITTQTIFRAHFMLRWSDSVPDRIFNP